MKSSSHQGNSKLWRLDVQDFEHVPADHPPDVDVNVQFLVGTHAGLLPCRPVADAMNVRDTRITLARLPAANAARSRRRPIPGSAAFVASLGDAGNTLAEDRQRANTNSPAF